jgi:hypothetical protein
MDKSAAIEYLGNFVRKMVADGCDDRSSYKDWVGEHEQAMEEMLCYKRQPGMGPITAMVQVSFHPRLDLIGLNYTRVAQNILWKFEGGWTKPLEMCRGIVYNFRGELVAKPFGKLHNSGEHDKLGTLPDESLEATFKHDGDCGINFWYARKFRTTTRGTFTYESARVAEAMIDRISERKGWKYKPDLKRTTIITEIIHPCTHHIQDYGRKRQLILIGAYNLDTLEDMRYSDLSALGKSLGLRVTELWPGNTVEELKAHVADRNTPGEGYVARFESGLRAKFKCATHVSKMIKAQVDQMGYGYLMNQLANGSCQEKLLLLDEESLPTVQGMVDQLNQARIISDVKQRRAHLYSLVPAEGLTDTYRGQCSRFLKSLAST